MSEERHASLPPEPTAAGKPVNGGSDGGIEVSIEEGEPEMEAKPVAVAAPSPHRVGETTVPLGSARSAPEAPPSSHRPGEATAKRARAKVTLKIPDDEISRPQVSPSAVPPKVEVPEAPLVPMTPMRIITIEPPPVVAKSVPPVRPPSAAPPPVSAPKPASAEDSWTPYQPTVADRAAQSAQPPLSVPRPPRPSYSSVSPGAIPPAPQPPSAPPRPSHHSAPGHATPAAPIPVAPPTVPMAVPPALESHGDSMDEIPIVTEDEAPPSSGEIEIDEDARPTRPAVLNVPEPKLVPAQPVAPAPVPAAPAATPPRVDLASVHTAVTPVAAPVAIAAAAAAPSPSPSPVAAAAAAPSPAAPAPAGPIAPTPPRVASVIPAPAPSQPQVNIKDLPPMRALLPTEPEGLEVHFEDEEPPVSSARASEPEAEIAAEDLVSVESAPSPSKQAAITATEVAARSSLPGGAPAAASAQATAASVASPAARGSLPPPPSTAAKPAATAGKPPPRVIVPTASPLAPPPMSDLAPTGRRKARPWWEELFNDDFIRTMAKISDAQIAKEVDFVEESLAVAKGAMLLDLGCGTGRHAIELTRRGYKVVGFDLSLPMLAKAAEEAQERGQKLNFVQGDMREMTFEDTFDGIYCWNTSFGFFEEEKNAQVIQRVHKALKKGGQFMLEVGNRDYIIRQAPSLAWFEGDGCICMDEMSIDWITSRMKVKRTMMMDDGRTKEIDYSVRIYSLHELGKVLHESGFRVAEVSGRTGTPGVYFGNESPRTMILAEKK